jgi:hypothetical protein
MTKHRSKHTIGVTRIDRQPGNALAIAEAQVRPGLTCIGGFVNSVADGQIGSGQALATGNINDVRVGGRHGNGADGLRGLRVEDRIPCPAEVIRLPDSAIYRADIKNVRLAGYAAGRASTPPRVGPIMRQRSS